MKTLSSPIANPTKHNEEQPKTGFSFATIQSPETLNPGDMCRSRALHTKNLQSNTLLRPGSAPGSSVVQPLKVSFPSGRFRCSGLLRWSSPSTPPPVSSFDSPSLAPETGKASRRLSPSIQIHVSSLDLGLEFGFWRNTSKLGAVQRPVVGLARFLGEGQIRPPLRGSIRAIYRV